MAFSCEKTSTTLPPLLLLLLWLLQLQCHLITSSATAAATMDCSITASLLSSCSNFMTYGAPDPALSTPCCDGVLSLDNIAAESIDNRRTACGCIMALITDYAPNTTAVGRLPGLCGVSLGFTIEPNTDCNAII